MAASPETRLALARALIDVGDSDAAAIVLADLAAADPADWRIAWYNGLRDLAARGPSGAQVAQGAFSAVYDELPGELAPKLALAFAAEAAGDLAAARHYYRLVWTIDRSYISAAFGAGQDLPGGRRPARRDRGARRRPRDVEPPRGGADRRGPDAGVRPSAGVTGDDLRQAGGRLGRLALDDVRRQQLTVEILRAALDWCRPASPRAAIPSSAAAECARWRFGLERSYRSAGPG